MAAPPLKMPGTAKAAIMDGVGVALTQFATLATMVGEAETSNGGEVPPEILKSLAETARQLRQLVAKVGGSAKPVDAKKSSEAWPADMSNGRAKARR